MAGLNLKISQVIEKQEEKTKGLKGAYKGEVTMMHLDSKLGRDKNEGVTNSGRNCGVNGLESQILPRRCWNRKKYQNG